MKNIVVLDIDGCCLDPEARLGHLKAGDYAAYEAAWRTDKPIPQGIAVYRSFLANPAYRCVFITSRSEEARENTGVMLGAIFGEDLGNALLLMRDNNFTSGKTLGIAEVDIKPYLLTQAGMRVEDVFIAFDDRDDCVEGWRKRGIVCYQTAYGDF